jgi:hypothetical protein
MKYLQLVILLLMPVFFGYSQGVKLANALVIGQFDKAEDRFSIEVYVTEIFNSLGIKAIPSINVMKQGADPLILASDTMVNNLKTKGFDTYVVVNVKGYDRKFKNSSAEMSLEDALKQTSIYHLYKDDITSITFEFSVFRNGKRINTNLLKVGNISNRDDVLKRFRKKAPKHLSNYFLAS